MTDKISLFDSKSFEVFCISVLRQIAVSENKEIKFETTLSKDLNYIKDNSLTIFDAIAEQGIGNIPGPTVFEIKYGKKSLNFKDILKNLTKKAGKAYPYGEISIVLITNQRYPVEYNDSNINERVTIIVWDVSYIEKWIDKYPIDFSNAINSFPTQNVINTSLMQDVLEEDFHLKSQTNADALKQLIQSDESFALVLGAGVSVDPGAKPWNKLLDSFKDELVKKKIIVDIKKLGEKIGDSSLITAQLCKELYKNETDYFWAIHQGLYANRVSVNNDFSIYHLSKIAQKCCTKEHFRVLTYNYDDYFEKYLDNLSVEYNSLYDKNSLINSKLSIYHVHGFLPMVKFKSHIENRHKNSIYLTEQDYNSLYNYPYSWQISSQLTIFRENCCLFVGCSLADPNIRRLLEITAEENRKHYAILTKDKMCSKDLLRAANHFSRLGIEIIWVEDFIDLRRQLSFLSADISSL